MHPNAPRLARTLACAAVAVPVLLASAGCSSSSDSAGDKASASPSVSHSPSPSAKPAAVSELPDPCKTVKKDTIEDVVPDADPEEGKNLGSADADAYGSCFWHGASGKLDGDYRSLTVSLKRYDSAEALGTGDEQAERYFGQQLKSVTGDKANEDLEQDELSDLGAQAIALTYTTVKKSDDEDEHTYRAGRVLVRVHNAVIMVDYEGTGFEDAKTPSAETVGKNARKVAEEVVAAVK